VSALVEQLPLKACACGAIPESVSGRAGRSAGRFGGGPTCGRSSARSSAATSRRRRPVGRGILGLNPAQVPTPPWPNYAESPTEIDRDLAANTARPMKRKPCAPPAGPARRFEASPRRPPLPPHRRGPRPGRPRRLAASMDPASPTSTTASCLRAAPRRPRRGHRESRDFTGSCEPWPTTGEHHAGSSSPPLAYHRGNRSYPANLTRPEALLPTRRRTLRTGCTGSSGGRVTGVPPSRGVRAAAPLPGGRDGPSRHPNHPSSSPRCGFPVRSRPKRHVSIDGSPPHVQPPRATAPAPPRNSAKGVTPKKAPDVGLSAGPTTSAVNLAKFR